MTQPVTVLISSRNRPIYLWACLDALYRYTPFPHKFVLVDMASDDPLVEGVLQGFERREMFSQVIRAPRNDAGIIFSYIQQNLESWAPYFAYIEADVVVEDATPCWLEQMATLMDQRPKLAMLGSAIDRRDFIDTGFARRLRTPEMGKRWRTLLKANSVERKQDVADANGAPVYRPHGPPGRLLMLRTATVRQVGLAADAEFDRRLIEAGYETGIATGVRHRHLSLLHLYDYPDYDTLARDAYMARTRPSE